MGSNDEIDVRLRRVRATLGARQPVTPQARDRSEESRPTVPALQRPPTPIEARLSAAPPVPAEAEPAGRPTLRRPGAGVPEGADEELALRVFEALDGDPVRLRTFRRFLRKLTGSS